MRTSMRKMVINLFQMMRRPPPHEVEVGQSPGKQRPRHDHSWDQPCKNLSIVMEGIDCRVFSESVLVGMWILISAFWCCCCWTCKNSANTAWCLLFIRVWASVSHPENTAPLFHYHSNVYICHTGTIELKTQVLLNIWCLIANKEVELVNCFTPENFPSRWKAHLRSWST